MAPLKLLSLLPLLATLGLAAADTCFLVAERTGKFDPVPGRNLSDTAMILARTNFDVGTFDGAIYEGCCGPAAACREIQAFKPYVGQDVVVASYLAFNVTMHADAADYEHGRMTYGDQQIDFDACRKEVKGGGEYDTVTVQSTTCGFQC